MKGKTFSILPAFWIIGAWLVAQPPEEKKIPEDAYGLTVDQVFDNMHYNQPLRPQVHYTPITGQIGDATGLILYKGTYHLFYMYDEWSRRRRFNKTWGHAVSHDLIYWQQLPQVFNTLLDNAPGSGSGIVDWNNTLGLRSGPEKTLVIFYTDYKRGTSLAFSPDAGRTWIRHKDNPVIPMPEGRGDRDAKVFWYKPDESWRLILYEPPGFAFYKSTDLLNWEPLSRMEGFHECPDFLHMPVDGNPEDKRWVMIQADASYRIGEFDGTAFQPKTPTTRVNHGRHLEYWSGADRELYGTQSWSHSYEGDGPFYQMGFLHLTEPPTHTRTWSQQQSFPAELTLKKINGEVRLCRMPIDGIKQLRTDPHIWRSETVRPGENPLSEIDGDVFEIVAEIEPAQAREVGFVIRGETLSYFPGDQKFSLKGSHPSLVPRSSAIRLRLIIDRNSIEVYANRGEVTLTKLFYPDPKKRDLEFFSRGGPARIVSMELYRLESIWLKREQELGYSR